MPKFLLDFDKSTEELAAMCLAFYEDDNGRISCPVGEAKCPLCATCGIVTSADWEKIIFNRPKGEPIIRQKDNQIIITY